MCITPAQANTISERIHRHLGKSAAIWLFGSRIDDNARGGDIDLYVETGSHPLLNELRCKVELEENLDMPVDLIVRPLPTVRPLPPLPRCMGSGYERTHPVNLDANPPTPRQRPFNG